MLLQVWIGLPLMTQQTSNRHVETARPSAHAMTQQIQQVSADRLPLPCLLPCLLPSFPPSLLPTTQQAADGVVQQSSSCISRACSFHHWPPLQHSLPARPAELPPTPIAWPGDQRHPHHQHEQPQRQQQLQGQMTPDDVREGAAAAAAAVVAVLVERKCTSHHSIGQNSWMNRRTGRQTDGRTRQTGTGASQIALPARCARPASSARAALAADSCPSRSWQHQQQQQLQQPWHQSLPCQCRDHHTARPSCSVDVGRCKQTQKHDWQLFTIALAAAG
jgi:hypothetical protein